MSRAAESSVSMGRDEEEAIKSQFCLSADARLLLTIGPLLYSGFSRVYSFHQVVAPRTMCAYVHTRAWPHQLALARVSGLRVAIMRHMFDDICDDTNKEL